MTCYKTGYHFHLQVFQLCVSKLFAAYVAAAFKFVSLSAIGLDRDHTLVLSPHVFFYRQLTLACKTVSL